VPLSAGVCDYNTNESGENIRGLTEIKIAKHRNGKLETIRLKALLHIQKFVNWDEDPYSGVGLPAGGMADPWRTAVGGGKIIHSDRGVDE